MTENKPLISIIVPIYNLENYIYRCLQSILGQTYTNFECLLIDDGSTDNSSKICDDFTLKDSRITVVHKKNEGVSIARNTGICVAKGEYICFLDGDDWYEPSLLEEAVYKIMETNSNVIMWGINFYDGDRIYKKVVNKNDKLEIDQIDFFPEWFNAPWTKIIKKTFLEENKISFPENISMAEDMYFSYKCFSKLESIFFINKPLYNYYNMRQDSACNTMNKKKVMDEIKCIDLLESELNNTYKVFKNSICQRKKVVKEKYLYVIETFEDVIFFRNLYPNIHINIKNIKYKIFYFFIKNKYNILVRLMLKVKIRCQIKQS